MPRTGAALEPGERRRLLRGLAQEPAAAARFLLGQWLLRRRGRGWLGARIVETEAYLGAGDPAAHAYRGRTPRTEPLWGPPGTVYVYFVYGMHHCLNVCVDAPGVPGCVLIRAAEPGRGARLPARALSGPGRLTRALGIGARESGRHLFEPGARLTLREGRAPLRIGVSPRIGIRQAADRPLRFFDADSPALSRLRTILSSPSRGARPSPGEQLRLGAAPQASGPQPRRGGRVT